MLIYVNCQALKGSLETSEREDRSFADLYFFVPGRVIDDNTNTNKIVRGDDRFSKISSFFFAGRIKMLEKKTQNHSGREGNDNDGHKIMFLRLRAA